MSTAAPERIAATEIAAAPVPWIGNPPASGTGQEARVLFTRVMTRRNFAGFPFWVSCPPETCARLAVRAREHAAAAGLGPGFRLADLAPETIGTLRERMMLPERPAAFPGKRDFKLLFTGNDPAAHALFGETEHWTHVRTLPGLATAEETLRLFTLEEDALEEGKNEEGGPVFSQSSAWGFLASDPSFAGTGLQFEAGLHLPALTAARKIPQAQQAMAAMGFELQPLSLRNSGAAEAGFFRLLSRGGLGLSGGELFRRFAGKAEAVLAAETGAWERWNAREPVVLEDRMHRALRLLQEARRMEFAELLFLSSFARAGVYAGIFPVSLLPRLEELRVKAQPFHVGAAREPAPKDAEEENVLRAGLARTLLQDAR